MNPCMVMFKINKIIYPIPIKPNTTSPNNNCKTNPPKMKIMKGNPGVTQVSGVVQYSAVSE